MSIEPIAWECKCGGMVPVESAVCSACGQPRYSLGWWVVSGDTYLQDLRRVAEGENPDLVYAEAYANATIEKSADSDAD
jgi:hypothetical protein